MKELLLDEMAKFTIPGVKPSLKTKKYMKFIVNFSNNNYPYPLMAVWLVTYRCNLNCNYCYLSKNGEELKTQEAKKLIEKIKEGGITTLVFSGGEPLLREDILELISYTIEKNINSILVTNGLLLEKDIIKTLRKIGLQKINISLDAAKEETYIKIRNEKAFYYLLDVIQILKKEGFFVILSFVVQRDNVNEIIDFIDLSKRLKVNRVIFRDLILPFNEGKNNKEIPFPQKIELLKLIYTKAKELNKEIEIIVRDYIPWLKIFIELSKFDKIQQMKYQMMGNFIGSCAAGKYWCGITPNGELLPCPYLLLKIGNILRENFLNLWQNSQILNDIRAHKFEGKCGLCEYEKICGGCRASAYALTGNYLASDENCKIN